MPDLPDPHAPTPAQTPTATPATADEPPIDPAFAQRESLIEYPSRFPIKVVGVNAPDFADAVADIARRFDPGFDAAGIERRESGGGKYLGLTITVMATSRAQLDELYRTLSTHPLARWVL